MRQNINSVNETANYCTMRYACTACLAVVAKCSVQRESASLIPRCQSAPP